MRDARVPKPALKVTKYHGGFPLASYDVSPDRNRFLMIKENRVATDSTTQDRVVVVLNWLEELQQKLEK